MHDKRTVVVVWSSAVCHKGGETSVPGLSEISLDLGNLIAV